MVLVGKSEDNADALLGDLQMELQSNQYIIEDFGEQYNAGCWQEGEFVTKDRCAFFSRGRGQSPRGLRFREMRPDYIVVDDLDDDEMCRSEARVREMTKWIKEALFEMLRRKRRTLCHGRQPDRQEQRAAEDHRQSHGTYQLGECL